MTSHGATASEAAEIADFVSKFHHLPAARKVTVIQRLRDEGFGQFADIFQRIADRDAELEAEDDEVAA